MITLAWYLLKVTICSGILCGYYYVALRNKIFHRWNRFYLLASVVLSLVVPLMKIDIFQNNAEDKGTVIRMLQTINSGDEIVIEYSRHSGLQLNSENIISIAYLLVTIVFLTVFFFALYKIYRLKKKYPEIKMKGINFISTDARGTPFSFFKSIFWNNAIDLHSRNGQQIFNHEIAHVKEKHSYDKIFMNVVLIFFWLNPFFWLMRKELSMIHEFIADKEALEDSDMSAFAEMVLQTVYPGQNFSLTNNFFHSPIKRRITMFTKNKNPKVNYISRLLALPLAAVIFFAFSLKMKNSITHYTGKKITVIIDAGHGGSDNGAMQNNINEKDLNLAIAKEIKQLNTNQNLNIILSRPGDETMTPQDRTKFAETNNADVFVSIHVDAETNKNEHNGMSVFIPKNDNPYVEQSQSLGSAIIQSFQNNYPLTISDNLQQRSQGIWVLKANEWPSVLIEAGFLSTQKDFDYLTNPKNQKTIAQNILNGIEKYAEQNLAYTIPETDTIPSEYMKNKDVNYVVFFNKKDSALVAYKDGRRETITRQQLYKRDILLPPPPPPPPPPKPTLKFKQNAMYVLDGNISSYDDIIKISPDKIGKIYVLNGSVGHEKYGDKARSGVIEVITKSGDGISKNTSNVQTQESNSIARNIGINTFSNTESDPIYFVDGKEVSKEKAKTISAEYIEPIKVLKGKSAIAIYGEKAKNGVVIITTKPGNLNTIVTVKNGANANNNSIHFNNEKNSGALNNTVTLNSNSNINGVKDTIPDKVFTKVENEAEFPGGRAAWTKYITIKIQASIDSFTEKDFGTCIAKFIVNTDGSISNVEATTMQGTHLARITVDAIKSGPRWIPATQNDITVAAYRLQPVTLSDPDAKQK